ncbi:Hypothetical predicted protein [Lecanosticta acicola]|uniref:Uncharacterized protein n=1 Tax=Lecanosticta acicola TaxID=111012 RepID=A0AAI8Z2F2_9PEZI|nr:Hypothetical predicted protein [Lecanosticta acicola]
MESRLSVPAATLGLQGLLNALGGVYGLVRPAAFVAQMAQQFGGGIQAPVVHGMSLQLLTMGIYTGLAATQPALHRPALAINVCLRLMAAYTFWYDGPQMHSVAMWEFLWAVWNGVTIPFAPKLNTV